MFKKLSQSPVFEGLHPQEIKQLLNSVQYSYRTYHKGNNLAFRGDTCDSLMILIEGTVKGEMLDLSGKLMEVETIHAPLPLAPAFIFSKDNRFPVDIVAQEDLTVIFISKSSLIMLFQTHQGILNNFLNIISNRANFLSNRLYFMSFKTIKEKFIHFLLSIAKSDSDKITLPKSQQELSEFFGVTRPSLARVIGELKKENIIEIKGRSLIIKNKNLLKDILLIN
jgi:CRP-like cAMP-binding protein